MVCESQKCLNSYNIMIAKYNSTDISQNSRLIHKMTKKKNNKCKLMPYSRACSVLYKFLGRYHSTCHPLKIKNVNTGKLIIRAQMIYCLTLPIIRNIHAWGNCEQQLPVNPTRLSTCLVTSILAIRTLGGYQTFTFTDTRLYIFKQLK